MTGDCLSRPVSRIRRDGHPSINPLYTMSNILDLQRLAIDTDEDAGWSTVSVNCNNTKAEAEVGR